MPLFGQRLAILGLCIVVTACAASAQSKEDMLATAGFTVVPANTPQRQASLTSLPSHKFVRRTRGDKVIYTYADPTICDCLYVGNEAAYGRYRQAVAQRQIAVEQPTTAEMKEEQDWKTWGLGPGAEGGGP